MTKAMPEQIEASKDAERRSRPTEAAASTQPHAPDAGSKALEAGELDEAALDQVSGGGIIKSSCSPAGTPVLGVGSFRNHR